MRRFWSWVLACTLLAAHTLGAVHGVAHARVASGAAKASPAVAAAAPLAGLFKTHDDGSGCRLFDQLSHGDAVPVSVVAVAPAAVAACTAAPATLAVLAPAPPSRARGPPSLA